MAEISQRQNILFRWLVFQFFDVPKGILKAWRNFLLFNLNYFSVPLLIRTLFAYWRRYQWAYPKGFEPGKYIEAFVSNLISRILGAIMRVFLISIGVLVEVFILFFGMIIFLGWLVLPILLILGLYHGFKNLF